MNSQTIIEQLSLSPALKQDIDNFLNIVSFYKIAPYVNFFKENPDMYKYLEDRAGIKNKWEAVIYLFRYNIKLSIALYPHIFLLETILKTRINSRLTECYTDYWFRDELLLLTINKIDNVDDLSLYNKYKNCEFTKDVSKNLEEDLQLINDQLKELGKEYSSNTKQRNKIAHIKRCCGLYQESKKALLENPRLSCIEFVENKTTLGYWLAILKISMLWENDVQLIKIFPKLPNNYSKNDLLNKLENIRILRNKIAHHCRIIGLNQIKDNISLKTIFNDIRQIFEFLGVDCDGRFDIMELKCNKHSGCNQRSFEILYNELEEIHTKVIKAKLPNVEATTIEMQDVDSSYCKKIGYNNKERIFQVEFKGGEIYQYFKVPAFLYEQLCKADSKGKFFIKKIRDSFNYKKVK